MKARAGNSKHRHRFPVPRGRSLSCPWVSAATGAIPRRHIRDYSRAVAREFRPEQIILFGSYACGRPGMDSDVDLLVVLTFRGDDLNKATQIRSLIDAPFPLDLLVRKPRFIAERLREGDMFIKQVVNQGVVMYEDQHA